MESGCLVRCTCKLLSNAYGPIWTFLFLLPLNFHLIYWCLITNSALPVNCSPATTRSFCVRHPKTIYICCICPRCMENTSRRTVLTGVATFLDDPIHIHVYSRHSPMGLHLLFASCQQCTTAEIDVVLSQQLKCVQCVTDGRKFRWTGLSWIFLQSNLFFSCPYIESTRRYLSANRRTMQLRMTYISWISLRPYRCQNARCCGNLDRVSICIRLSEYIYKPCLISLHLWVHHLYLHLKD